MPKTRGLKSPRPSKDIAVSLAESGNDGQDSGGEDQHAGLPVDSGDCNDPGPNVSSLGKQFDSADRQHSLLADAPTVTTQQGRAKRLAADASPAGRQDQSQSSDEIDNTLTVGRNTHLDIKVANCETFVVQGKVKATAKSRVLHIGETGVYNGEIEVETAEISGHFDGKLLARKYLVIHSTGKVSGSIRYGGLRIDDGGQIFGDVQVVDLTEKVVEESTLKPIGRLRSRRKSSKQVSEKLSDFSNTAHINALLSLVGQFKKSHIHEDSERNDVGAEQKEISDPDRSDGTADIPGARPALN